MVSCVSAETKVAQIFPVWRRSIHDIVFLVILHVQFHLVNSDSWRGKGVRVSRLSNLTDGLRP